MKHLLGFFSYIRTILVVSLHFFPCIFFSLTLIPALTRKSTSTDLILVWPDLKSSPPMNTPVCMASSMAPGTKVFCGEPFRKAQPSSILATANRVEGETSAPAWWMKKEKRRRDNDWLCVSSYYNKKQAWLTRLYFPWDHLCSTTLLSTSCLSEIELFAEDHKSVK